jgi:hypothetical protein
MNEVRTTKASFSIFSIIAIVAALLSFATGAVFGLILAVIAIICGIIGMVMASSSKTRGGVISVFSLVAGGLGILAAVIKAIMWVV